MINGEVIICVDAPYDIHNGQEACEGELIIINNCVKPSVAPWREGQVGHITPEFESGGNLLVHLKYKQ